MIVTSQNHIDDCNIVFNKLVQNENDIIGLLAYSYYKVRKKEAVDAYKIQNSISNIPETQLKTICGSITAGKQFDDFRKKAEEILQQFAADILKEDMNDLEFEFERRLKIETKKMHSQISSQLTAIDKKILKKGFWYGIWQNLFSSFIFMLLPVMVIAIYISSQMDWKDVFDFINTFHQIKK